MISDPRADEPAAKLRLACDLFDTGVAMMRQTLQRRFPTASDQAIADALAAWLRERPGAEHGDALGRLRDWSPL
jgi:Rv0078B-related antitoxin